MSRQRKTIFISLVKAEANSRRLLLANQDNTSRKAMFLEKFLQIDGTPFAYWLGASVLAVYSEKRPISHYGLVKQGLATADDFRFVRCRWEIKAEKIGFNKTDTFNGKSWVNFAKGGGFSEYFYDHHLLVEFEDNGFSIRNFYKPDGTLASRPQNLDLSFTPGITWSDRTTKNFSARAWPNDGVFSIKGSCGFFEERNLGLMALMNSAPFRYLLNSLVGAADAAAKSYQVGTISKTPAVYSDKPRIGVDKVGFTGGSQ